MLGHISIYSMDGDNQKTNQKIDIAHGAAVAHAAAMENVQTPAIALTEESRRQINYFEELQKALEESQKYANHAQSKKQSSKAQTLLCERLNQYMPITEIQRIILGYLDSSETYVIDDDCTKLACSPAILATVSRDGTIKLTHVTKNKIELKQIMQPMLNKINSHDHISQIAFSPNGLHLAAANNAGTIQIWKNINNRFGHFNCARVLQIRSYCLRIAALAFIDSSRFVVASEESLLSNVYEFKVDSTYADKVIFSDSINTFDGMAFSANGQYVAYNGKDRILLTKKVIVRDLSRNMIQDFFFDNESVSLAFTPHGDHLAIGGTNGIEIYALVNNSFSFKQVVCTDARIVAFSPDSTYLIAGMRNNGIEIWRLDKNKFVHSEDAYEDTNVFAIAFSEDGNFCALGAHDKTIKIWQRH